MTVSSIEIILIAASEFFLLKVILLLYSSWKHGDWSVMLQTMQSIFLRCGIVGWSLTVFSEFINGYTGHERSGRGGCKWTRGQYPTLFQYLESSRFFNVWGVKHQYMWSQFKVPSKAPNSVEFPIFRITSRCWSDVDMSQ